PRLQSAPQRSRVTERARYGRAAGWLVGTKGEYPFSGTYLPPKGAGGQGEELGWKRCQDEAHFAILRLYGSTETAIDKSWKPGDTEKAQKLLQSHWAASSTSLVAVCDVIRDAGPFDFACHLILDERDRLVERRPARRGVQHRDVLEPDRHATEEDEPVW